MAVLKLNSNSAAASSVWQMGGYLHAHWCLHYMQASFPWHRAHLLWLEAELGVPIPYWNFFSSQAKTKGSADYGLPQAFLDDTFTDPNGKQVLDAQNNPVPNPLRHALARGGKSRAWTEASDKTEVTRATELTTTGATLDTYITTFVTKYLDEIWHATQIQTFSANVNASQKDEGFNYGAPQDLGTDNPTKFYPDVTLDFDVALEQAHDNYHGWCGPDMANNSFAAYDPLFWSFHANFDRIFEKWVRQYGDKQTWTFATPLRPFVISIKQATPTTPIEVDVSVVEDGDP